MMTETHELTTAERTILETVTDADRRREDARRRPPMVRPAGDYKRHEVYGEWQAAWAQDRPVIETLAELGYVEIVPFPTRHTGEPLVSVQATEAGVKAVLDLAVLTVNATRSSILARSEAIESWSNGEPHGDLYWQSRTLYRHAPSGKFFFRRHGGGAVHVDTRLVWVSRAEAVDWLATEPTHAITGEHYTREQAEAMVRGSGAPGDGQA